MPETFDAYIFTYVAAAFLLLETVFLFAFLRRRRPTLATSIVLNGVSGLCLMASLITMLAGGGLTAFAAWLFAALVAHLSDLLWRLQRSH